jgi:hypothetical protein
MSTQYCADLPGVFTNNQCPTDEQGGIISVAYIDCDTFDTLDLSSDAEWITELAAGNIKVILFTKGSYEGPEWETDDGYGLVDEVITGAGHVLNYRHRVVWEQSGGTFTNRDFYNKLAKAPGSYYVTFVDSSLNMKVSTQPVTVKPKDVTPEGKKELQEWQVEVNWNDPNIATFVSPAPASAYS